MPEIIYAKNPDVVFRKIADEFILVPIRQRVADLKSIFTLNESATLVWELIDGKKDAIEISRKLTESYEIEPRLAESDTIGILSQLESLGLIQKA